MVIIIYLFIFYSLVVMKNSSSYSITLVNLDDEFRSPCKPANQKNITKNENRFNLFTTQNRFFFYLLCQK